MYHVAQAENSLMIEIIVSRLGADARWYWIGMVKTKAGVSHAELYKHRVF